MNELSMPGTGTIINALLALLGGLLGLALKRGISERFSAIIFNATGAGVFLVGLTGVMSTALTAAQNGEIHSRWGLMLILSLVIGAALGEALRLDRAFDRLGEALKKRVALVMRSDPGENTGFGAGFTVATIIFCSGAMSIIGAIEDAAGAPTTLMIKGVIDCITALIFTTSFGAGVLLAAGSVLVYQGAIVLVAAFAAPLIPPAIISQMSLVGSAVLILIPFSMWKIKDFRVACFIPAAFMPLVLYWIPFLR